MDYIVCLKQVADLDQVRIKRDTREPVTEGVPFVFGDFEKNALEAAVQLREKHGGTVIALALGTPKLKDLIIEALAIGADEAVILTDPALTGGGSSGTAAALASAVRKLGRGDLVLMGEGSADNYSGQVTGRVAEILGWPQVTYVRELGLVDGHLRATRDLEEALEVVEADLPAVVSVTSELNTPRLPPLTAILKASRKPISAWTAADLGLPPDAGGRAAPMIEELSNLAPEQERKQMMLEGDHDAAVADLVKALDKEGVLAR